MTRCALFLLLVVIIILITSPKPAHTADITQVQSNAAAAQNANSISIELGQAATTGNLLVVICGVRDAGAITGPTGFTNATPLESGVPAQAIFYKISTGGENDFECTSDTTEQRKGIFAAEYSGVATTDTFLGSDFSTGDSATPQAGEVNVGVPSLLVAGITINTDTGGGGIDPWTNLFDEIEPSIVSGGSPNLRSGYAGAFRVVTESGAYTTSATAAASGPWRGQIVAFRADGYDPPALTMDVVDSSGTAIPNPALSMSQAQVGFSCQEATGVLGVSEQRLRISNSTATPGWTVSIAATAGPTAVWSASEREYSYNDPSGDGCDNGQLTIQPSSASIDPGSCTTSGLNLGTNTAFVADSVDNITLLSADSGADTGCSWEVTGIGMEQDIPAEQPAGEYSLDMTLTLVAD